MKSYAFSLLLCITAILSVAPVDAATDEENLAFAKQERVIKLQKIQLEFLRDIDVHIKKAVFSDDLETAKTLFHEKDGFVEREILPVNKKLLVAVDVYVSRRKVINGTYVTKVEVVIKSLSDSGLQVRADEVKADLDSIVKREKTWAERALANRGVKEPNQQIVEADREENATTKSVAKFSALYLAVMKKAFEQETSAQQDNMYKEGIKKLNDAFQDTVWSFNCRIRDIEKESNGSFIIYFQAPEELSGASFDFECRSNFTMRLEEKMAISLKSGDYIIISGKPLIRAGSSSSGSQLLQLNYATNKYQNSISSLALVGIKTVLKKTKDE